MVAAASSYSCMTALLYEEVHREFDVCRSEFAVVSFNQGSTSDTKSPVEHISGSSTGGRGLAGTSTLSSSASSSSSSLADGAPSSSHSY
ncbi:hypothetical protein GQ54DRAFT_299681 [Martensiomyces pterosporus]|nr:hypothetical protein GQ54DRAFT_299681 [Martensiomyces pterosporus]